MSAVDEILAAIVKLSEQKEHATAGPWFAWHAASSRGNSSVDAPSQDTDNPEMVVEGGRKDVELIVTLHRTIDAQLAILADAIGDRAPRYFDYELFDHFEVIWKLPLLLARAINGGTA